jgi:hypothetical protein
MTISMELIKKESIAELCGHRDRALVLYRQALLLLAEANKTARKAHGGNRHGGYSRYDVEGMVDISEENSVEGYMNTIRTCMDRGIWRHLTHTTRLGSLMDREALREFEKSLESKDIPEATMDTIVATFFQKAAEAPEIFRRGLINTFSRLAPGYKTNSPFRIGDKIIFDHAMSVNTWNDRGNQRRSMNFYAFDTSGKELQDIERVLRILDGKTPFDNGIEGICGKISAAVDTKETSTSDEYFEAKWFWKGSLHVTFKRPDLIHKANQMIAQHFGETIPDEDSRHRYHGSKKRPKRRTA